MNIRRDFVDGNGSPPQDLATATGELEVRLGAGGLRQQRPKLTSLKTRLTTGSSATEVAKFLFSLAANKTFELPHDGTSGRISTQLHSRAC